MHNLSEIQTRMILETGVDPLAIYCQFTGKRIGTLDADELAPILSTSTDELDAICDDLLMRTLASMRPSVAWNIMRSATLQEMMQSRPIDTLSYLLNRLISPRDSIKMPFLQRLEDLHSRIRLHASLVRCEGIDFTALLYMLIEVDAKMNLTEQECPIAAHEFYIIDSASFESILERVTVWHAALIRRWTKMQSDIALAERFKLRGNSMAKPAFFKAWMQAKPETARRTKAAGRSTRKVDQLMEDIFTELNGGISQHVANGVPIINHVDKPYVKPTVSTKAPTRFGGLKVAEKVDA